MALQIRYGIPPRNDGSDENPAIGAFPRKRLVSVLSFAGRVMRKPGEAFGPAAIGALGLRRNAADGRVVDQALAEGVDGHRAHLGTPVVDEVAESLIFTTGGSGLLWLWGGSIAWS